MRKIADGGSGPLTNRHRTHCCHVFPMYPLCWDHCRQPLMSDRRQWGLIVVEHALHGIVGGPGGVVTGRVQHV